MLESYFETPFVVDRLRSGPSGPYVDGFAQRLERQGYSWWTARGHLRAAAHLGQFAQAHDIVFDSIGRAALEAFRLHLPSCRCPRSNGGTTEAVVRGAKLFVAHLCEIGVLESREAERKHAQHPLVESFQEWLLHHRGAAESTRNTYGQGASDLLDALGDDLGRYDAQSLRAFVRERAQSHGVGSAKSLISALRMFLRYLAIEGKCRAGLDQAIPALAGWRLAALPRSLSTTEVEKIIACCEPTSPMGLRDRAIILLLARLGLRAGDVAALRLSDIDWNDGSLVVSGKGRREARLPLPQEVGDAILEYIEQRPRTGSDEVFLRTRVPVGPFRCAGSVSAVVRRVMGRAGISSPSYGAHILRHTAATHMLGQGVSLFEIGSVLRHRSLDMSAYYAKVDTDLLRQVAQPWPQVPTC
jgi:integrase